MTNRRTLGVNFEAGVAEILLWVPQAKQVSIRPDTGNDLLLEQKKRGYWQMRTGELRPGMNYQVVIDGETWPDIHSLYQPDGVHGASSAFDVSGMKWTDQRWDNIPLQNYLIYELHTGTFTPEGTFDGIAKKLDYLAALGITAIELMPVAQFPGDRNWGYDGVFPYAVHNSYGGPAALQQLVDQCHRKGLAVILDVVYNHIGPEGNYFGKYGPFFTEKYKTPWGNAINFDDSGCDEVRRYFIENALMWCRDFHVDALRLDAVHAIKDFSPVHVLKELTLALNDLKQCTGKSHYLIAECDLNDHRFIDPLKEGGYELDSQWLDEFHHALRISAGGKREGYYGDFHGIEDLGAAFEHAYVYHGRYSEHRQKTFGTDPVENQGQQFVVFSQNHDQVGNRMLGERSSALFNFEMQKLMAASVMVSPFLPMLFMGEEYAESNPFLYFVSHTDPELITAVQKGRKAEFEAFHTEGDAPDPQDENTFHRSKLQWEKIGSGTHRTMFNYYQALLNLRKSHPVLRVPDRQNMEVNSNKINNTLLLTRWCNEKKIHCLLNFSTRDRECMLPAFKENVSIIFNSASAEWGGPVINNDAFLSSSLIVIPAQSILIFEEYV